MKYPSGQEVRVGDRIRIGSWSLGTVVFSIDLDEYSEGYPRSQWAYLGRGVMVLTEAAGLIHYTESEPEMELVARGAASA